MLAPSAYSLVTIVALLLTGTLWSALLRSERWASSEWRVRIALAACATSVSAAIWMVAAFARVGLSLLDALAIVSARAYPLHCERQPFDSCYATQRNAFAMVLFLGWPLPLTAMTGAALLWGENGRDGRLVGYLLCGVAIVAVIIAAIAAPGDVWMGPPLAPR